MSKKKGGTPGISYFFIEATVYSKRDMDRWTRVDPVYMEDGVIQHTWYDRVRYIESSFPG
ncbi:hypothetical protein ACKUB1_11505 [Methanospirillum stamsii]|uniref:Uncharacterized protein n=1 Tax=Methanospirillum stamsii TaxID=1277351 RepID=A0A2V2MZZ1_9EURY|nr:hypothetical protein [Methanospirillum stamsii]PWR71895.1 hypothetical protein DLD82_12815 [Methanospirillum stamsii]